MLEGYSFYNRPVSNPNTTTIIKIDFSMLQMLKMVIFRFHNLISFLELKFIIIMMNIFYTKNDEQETSNARNLFLFFYTIQYDFFKTIYLKK